MSRASALLFAFLAVSACSERWDGFVYPKKDRSSEVHRIGTYSSLADCRRAARSVLAALDATTGDFECGLNCRPPDSGGLHVCEETSR
jgi:hypothetical protein